MEYHVFAKVWKFRYAYAFWGKTRCFPQSAILTM